MHRTIIMLVSAIFLLTACESPTAPDDGLADGPAACAALSQDMQGRWPDPSTRTLETTWHDDGSTLELERPPISLTLPAHCELVGSIRSRVGADGQNYAIKFHVRLPRDWTGRFLFEGGGGSNGNLGNAIGMTSYSGGPTALEQGFAVVSQDSGHDNAVNTVAERNGRIAFGLDPVARANYGGDSLKHVADAAGAVIRTYYGRNPDWSYFNGCSKGGQEGMVFAQRHPEIFDGIMANAPGFSLPRAAVAEIWDLQSFAAVSPAATDGTITLQQLSSSFSDDELALARDAVLAACDEDDGAKDGITAAFESCDTARVLEAMRQSSCAASNADAAACLEEKQIQALARVHAGPKAANGTVDLYSDWPWDGGLGTPGWRSWKIGSADGRIPSLNFVLGALALPAVFTTPPQVVANDPVAIGNYVAAFDFDRDASRIYTTDDEFTRSGWDVGSARSTDLRSFRDRGGKMMVLHGVSDPVFSINDTLAWYRDVDRLSGDEARDFARVFPLPGMTHCGGGRSVAEFRAFDALVAWVEHGEEPAGLVARGGAGSPWPDRTRPVCAYPEIAYYDGSGSIEDAENFRCVERVDQQR